MEASQTECTGKVEWVVKLWHYHTMKYNIYNNGKKWTVVNKKHECKSQFLWKKGIEEYPFKQR